MRVYNIEEYEVTASTHYSIHIEDPKATVEQIDELLQQIESVERLTINCDISRMPKLVKEVVEKSLQIRTNTAFLLEESRLPITLEQFDLKTKGINQIPEQVWHYLFVIIHANNIENQAFSYPVDPKTEVLHLQILNLTTFPLIPLRICRIASNQLTVIPNAFFEKNKDYLTSLSIDDSQINSITTDVTLSELHYFRWKTEQAIAASSFSFLPNSIQNIQITANKFDLDFNRFTNLFTLHIEGLVTNKLNLKSQTVSRLGISKSRIESFEEVHLPALTQINISETLQKIPSFLFQSSFLQSLFLNKNHIKEIPDDWSSLSQLSHLSLNDNGIVFENFDFALTLPKLKALQILGNQVKNKYLFLTQKKIPFSDYRLHELLGCSRKRTQDVLRFGAALAKAQISEDQKMRFFDAYLDESDFTSITKSVKDLMAAFKVNFQELKLFLNDYLTTLSNKRSGMKSVAAAVVYIDGTPTQSKAEVTELLEKNGATVVKRWSADVTHVLLGKKPSQEGSFAKHIKYLSEQDLSVLEDAEKFINVQVKQGNNTILENVNALLLNEEPANVLIGLNMLKNGGVNEKNFSSLLVIAKANPDAKVRKEAKNILAVHGPKEWNGLLESKLLFKGLHKSAKEQDVNNKLLKLSKEVGMGLACELSLGLFERFNKGLRFMVTREKYPKEYKQRMYDLLCPEHHFDLAAGIGFKNWKGKDPQEIVFNTYKMKLPMHEGIVDHKKVTSICLHNSKLTAIPKTLNEFKDLKVVDLSCNNIQKIPAYFRQLDQLEELDLSMNTFDEFPEQLLKMPQLRKIDFRHNRTQGFMGNFLPLEIPKEARVALPNCEILN